MSVLTSHFARLGVLLALVVFGTSRAFGAEMRVEASIESATIIVGKPFTLAVRVIGPGTPDQRPDLSWLEELSPRYVGSGTTSSMSVMGSQVERTTETTFTFEMSVSQVGRYTIPPIPVRVDGRTLRSEPITFSAGLAPETDELRVVVEVDSASVYEGEPVGLTLTLYTTQNILTPRISMGGDVGRFDLTTDPRWTGNQRVAFEFLGGEVPVTIERATLDGRAYTSVSVRRMLVPREPGRWTLGPAEVVTEFTRTVRQGFRERRVSLGDARALSAPIEIEVRPLPDTGRPEGFAGLVGRFAVRSEASPTEVNVGDPIDLQISVTGGPLLGEVGMPPLETLPGFSDAFRVAEEVSRTQEPGRVLFAARIRALDDGVREIPGIQLAYFDPERGEYDVARSEPIPIRVRPTRRVTASDAIGASPVIVGEEIGDVASGIAHNYEGAAALRSVPAGVGAVITRPVWVASIVGPPLAFVACALVGVGRRRSERRGDARGRQRALGEAMAMLGTADSVERVGAAVDGYFASMSGRPRGSITPRDVEEILSGASPDRATSLASLLERCDAVRFAGSNEDARRLADEAAGLLREVDPGLRRAAR